MKKIARSAESGKMGEDPEEKGRNNNQRGRSRNGSGNRSGNGNGKRRRISERKRIGEIQDGVFGFGGI